MLRAGIALHVVGVSAGLLLIAVTPAAADFGVDCAVPAVDDKCEAWVTTWNGAGNGPDGPGNGFVSSRVMATSADGAITFLAGTTDGDPGKGLDLDEFVQAYATGTGKLLWSQEDTGPTGYPNAGIGSLAVANLSGKVLVTGNAYGPDGACAESNVAAYDPASGRRLWNVLLGGSSSTCVTTNQVAASGDGRRVFVAADVLTHGTDGTTSEAALIQAFDAKTGRSLWRQTLLPPGGTVLRISADRLAASPVGSLLYVAGAGYGSEDGQRFFTVDNWLATLDGRKGLVLNVAHRPTKIGFPPADIQVAPGGSRVFVEAANLETALNTALTLAYDAAGRSLWSQQFRGCAEFKCSTRPWYSGPLAVSGDGAEVFLTGLSVRTGAATGFTTVAYDAATGTQLWTATYDGNVGDCFCGPVIQANPKTDDVYITGGIHLALLTNSGDSVTIAYDGKTGRQRWIAWYPYEPLQANTTSAIAVTPDGKRLLVAGGKVNSDGTTDVLTMAYDTS
jgi:hypothetical protein